MSKMTIIAAALVMAMVPATAAHAVFALSQTQTLNFATPLSSTHNYTGNQSTQFTSTPQILTFNQFDTLAGRRTLTAVTITWTPTLASTFSFTNGSGNARNLSLTFNTTSTLSAGSLFSIPQPFTNAALQVLIPQQSQGALTNVNISNSGTFTSLTPALLTPYIGASTISVSNALSSFTSSLVSNQGGLGNLTGASSGNLGGQFRIVYNFLDPIPEPGTWAMLIAGFGLTGASMRRRRATAQPC